MTIQEVYDFMAGRDVSSSFSDKAHNSQYDFEDFVSVDKEAKKVKAELLSKLNGSFKLTAKVNATYDEEGEILTEEVPATYYVVTTETALISGIESELDIIKILNVLKDGSTWTAYKASFN